MRLESTFTVPGPVDTAWETLLDLERVATCVPGATLHDAEGDTFSGRVAVKLGPIALAYRADGRFLERDREQGRVVIEGSGREDRGNGTARATVTLSLTPDGARTRCAVVTDLAVTGRPAQFGRGMLQDVSNALVDQFAANLERELGPATRTEPTSTESTVTGSPVTGRPTPGPGSTTGPRSTTGPAPAPDAALDLRLLLGPVVRRAAPVALALVGAAALAVAVHRSRRRR